MICQRHKPTLSRSTFWYIFSFKPLYPRWEKHVISDLKTLLSSVNAIARATTVSSRRSLSTLQQKLFNHQRFLAYFFACFLLLFFSFYLIFLILFSFFLLLLFLFRLSFCLCRHHRHNVLCCVVFHFRNSLIKMAKKIVTR